MVSFSFLFSKFVSAFLSPLLWFFLLLTMSLLFWRKKIISRVIGFLALFLLCFFSSPWVANKLISQLEFNNNPTEIQKGKWVVVLGAGNRTVPSGTALSALTTISAARVTEGVILRNQTFGKLILSGGNPLVNETEAASMAKVAEALGVEKENILLEEKSLNTESQAFEIRKILGTDSFYLVTSAFHMPRAIFLFEKNGLKPIPYPADRFVSQGRGNLPAEFIPSGYWLNLSEIAIREIVGMWKARMF